MCPTLVVMVSILGSNFCSNVTFEEIYEFFFVSKFGVMHLNISEDTLCTASSIDPSDYDKSVFNTDYTETLVLNTLTFFVCDRS